MDQRDLHFSDLQSLFKALSDPSRLRVALALIRHPELCACHISDFLGVRPATTSRHMDVLLASGLVTRRKVGRWTHYRINPDHFAAATLARWFKQLEKDDTLQGDLAVLNQRVECSAKASRTVRKGETP